MSTDHVLLSEVPFFELLDTDETKALAAVMERQSSEAGTVIFRYGELGDSLYLIRSGEVELFVHDDAGQKILLTIAKSGDIFGELSLLDNGPRTATAVVIKDADLLILNRDDLLKFLRSKPDAALDLLAVLGQRVRNSAELLRGRVARNANEEIEQELSLLQRFANGIAAYSGSISFFAINAAIFFSWIMINLGYLPGVEPFDPYPFGFLTLTVSLEAIFLSILVLLAQNLQVAKDKIRGDIEYDVNLKAELEIGELHRKFDQLQGELVVRLHNIDRLLKVSNGSARLS